MGKAAILGTLEVLGILHRKPLNNCPQCGLFQFAPVAGIPVVAVDVFGAAAGNILAKTWVFRVELKNALVQGSVSERPLERRQACRDDVLASGERYVHCRIG